MNKNCPFRSLFWWINKHPLDTLLSFCILLKMYLITEPVSSLNKKSFRQFYTKENKVTESVQVYSPLFCPLLSILKSRQWINQLTKTRISKDMETPQVSIGWIQSSTLWTSGLIPCSFKSNIPWIIVLHIHYSLYNATSVLQWIVGNWIN